MTAFDSAWADCAVIARTFGGTEHAVVVVRDTLGRISLAYSFAALNGPRADVEAEMRSKLGAYASPMLSHDLDDRFVRAATIDAPDAFPDLDPSVSVKYVDRSAVGSDWRANSSLPGDVPRLAFYGFKGGVGRSTAAARTAIRLANEGRRVLAIDLDLESPGLGDMLLGDMRPKYGIVDHLVSSAVDPDDRTDFVLESPYGGGQLYVAPADGKREGGYGYLPKLNRIYSPVPSIADPGVLLGFGDRLEMAVQRALDQAAAIDAVILDSRAGLHDIAVVSLTRLATHRFLFAQNSLQTRSGLRDLLTSWRDAIGGADWDAFDQIRRSTSTVAALSPPDPKYFEAFADEFQAIYAEALYDDAEPGDDEVEPFTFAPDDSSAPHYPVPIRHYGSLTALDSLRVAAVLSEDATSVAYDAFDRAVDRVLGGEA